MCDSSLDSGPFLMVGFDLIEETLCFPFNFPAVFPKSRRPWQRGIVRLRS